MSPRHHPLTIALHWLTFAVILVVVTAILMREVTEGSALRQFLLALHRSLGICVLLLAAARLVVRLSVSTKHLAHGLSEITRKLSLLVHISLYGFLVAMPMSGWLQASAAGKPVLLLGLVPLPPLLAKDRDLAEQIGDIHELMAWTLLTLIALHVFAALWHHFWRKDHVLHSMLPARLTQKIGLVDEGIAASIGVDE